MEQCELCGRREGVREAAVYLDGEKKTVPVAIQIAMQGAYGSTDYGGLMAMLVLAMIPIVVFYLFCQKYIIKGVVAGAVKG